MNREIKFRAWDNKNKVMYPRATQSLSGGVHACFSDGKMLSYLEEGRGELMQYTELIDKNGKEIYEKDIVAFDKEFFKNEDPQNEWTEGKGVVKYNDIWGAWMVEDVQYDEPYVQLTRFAVDEELEVIGNIYENPELLNDT